jgi:flagellar basal body-associated protein FliL
MKEYYSELTFIVRKYLDEKVYNHALESTTDELVSRLNLLKDGNQIELSKDDIRNIETILKRADLVKFAKSAPDVALAEIDRNTIDLEIDHVKEALPEPTEEEKLLDAQYKEEQARKKKRRKIIITIAISVFLFLATVAGFVAKFGYDYVKDTVIGHESKELLEGEWVTSDYGSPPVTISTPVVLKRLEMPETDTPQQVKTSIFSYGTALDQFSVTIISQVLPQQQKQGTTQDEENTQGIDLSALSKQVVAGFEAKGMKNIVALRDKFETPNAAEGLKTYGSMSLPILGTDKLRAGKFVLVQFNAENILQQVIITAPDNDEYANKTIARMLESIEVKPTEK